MQSKLGSSQALPTVTVNNLSTCFMNMYIACWNIFGVVTFFSLSQIIPTSVSSQCMLTVFTKSSEIFLIFSHYKKCFNCILAILNNLLWNIATYIFLHRGWSYFREQSALLASIFEFKPCVGGCSKVGAVYLTPLCAPPRGLPGNCFIC